MVIKAKLIAASTGSSVEEIGPTLFRPADNRGRIPYNKWDFNPRRYYKTVDGDRRDIASRVLARASKSNRVERKARPS